MAIFNAIPIARIDPNFFQQIEQLKEVDRSIYQSAIGTDQRLWQLPNPNPTPSPWNYNLFNIEGIRQAFDRTNPNKLYLRALLKGPPVGVDIQESAIPTGEGRSTDCQVEKIQIDYLASQERAFRLRHSSIPRCAMHAAARRKGHSSLSDQGAVTLTINSEPQDMTGPIGGVFTTMIRYLLLLIESGYNEPAKQLDIPETVIKYSSDGTASVDTEAIDGFSGISTSNS
jgi:hypothetical protein